MGKKKNSMMEFTGNMVLSGTGLTLGSAAIGKLPSTPATSQVQKGFTTASKFFPTFASIGALSITKDQFDKIKFKKMKGGK